MVDNQKVPNDTAASQTGPGLRREGGCRRPACSTSSSALILPATILGMRKVKLLWDCLQALSTLVWTLTAVATFVSWVIAYALPIPVSIIALVPTVVFVALSGAMAWRQSRRAAPSVEPAEPQERPAPTEPRPRRAEPVATLQASAPLPPWRPNSGLYRGQLQELLARGVELRNDLTTSPMRTPFLNRMSTREDVDRWVEEVRLALWDEPLTLAEFDQNPASVLDFGLQFSHQLHPEAPRLEHKLNTLERIIRSCT